MQSLIMKKTATILLILFMVTSVFSQVQESDLIGTWSVIKLEINTANLDNIDREHYEPLKKALKESIFEINADKSFTLKIDFKDLEDYVQNVIWSFNKEIAMLTVNDRIGGKNEDEGTIIDFKVYENKGQFLFTALDDLFYLYVKKDNVSTTNPEYAYKTLEIKHGDANEFSDSNLANIWTDANSLNDLAWHAYLEHNDIDVLLKAIKIIERSVALQRNTFNLDTHASLLYKTGNYTKALKKAKEAIESAKNDNIDYSETTKLIDKIIDKL